MAPLTRAIKKVILYIPSKNYRKLCLRLELRGLTTHLNVRLEELEKMRKIWIAAFKNPNFAFKSTRTKRSWTILQSSLRTLINSETRKEWAFSFTISMDSNQAYPREAIPTTNSLHIILMSLYQSKTPSTLTKITTSIRFKDNSIKETRLGELRAVKRSFLTSSTLISRITTDNNNTSSRQSILQIALSCWGAWARRTHAWREIR